MEKNWERYAKVFGHRHAISDRPVYPSSETDPVPIPVTEPLQTRGGGVLPPILDPTNTPGSGSPWFWNLSSVPGNWNQNLRVTAQHWCRPALPLQMNPCNKKGLYKRNETSGNPHCQHNNRGSAIIAALHWLGSIAVTIVPVVDTHLTTSMLPKAAPRREAFTYKTYSYSLRGGPICGI